MLKREENLLEPADIIGRVMYIDASVVDILQKAKELSRQKKSWHFHILTPGCLLNSHPDYALILEVPSDDQTFVDYSKERPMEVGKELVKLLHGGDVVQDAPLASTAASDGIKKILERASRINARGDFWHHHMLFPDCTFNKNPGKWTLILEDPQAKEILESVTGNEPKEDLKQIETLFYSQQF